VRCIIPPKLPAHGTLGIVAPSGPFAPERLQSALAYLRARGYQIREGVSLYARNRYLAGTDAQRVADLHAMFCDPGIDAIMAARGGYGSARLLPLLDWDAIARHPKPFIGLSDTTALQLGLFARTGLVSFSGLALCSDLSPDGFDPFTEKSVWDALSHHTFEPIGGLTALRPGDVTGLLIGGCLSLVASLAGSPFLPPCEGAILYLEDINEPLYKVDRMLTQLLMAGVFEGAAAVVFGQFRGSVPDTPEEGSLAEVFEDFTDRVPCPVYFGLPYGHEKTRAVMPVGLPGRIADGRLTIHLDPDHI
jgi:muramoyltetrapeptide carboxypeptidase